MTAEATICAGCGTEVAPALFACPSCRALVHRERLDALARDAAAAEEAKDFTAASRLWREALALLPAGSRQSEVVADRVESAVKAAQRADLEALRRGDGSRLAKILGPIAVAAIVLFSELKLLFLGLTKMGTLVSMFLSLGVYWTAWGWKFALAIVAGIYVHEIGHLAAMRRRGMRPDAPMFVPGLGAFVRMRERVTPAEDATIGLAGPWWGFGVAVVALIVWLTTGARFWGAVAHTTAWITVFNLTPVWQLDGSRAFRPLSVAQRWGIAALVAIAFAATREGTLLLVALVAATRAFEKRAPRTHDWRAFAQYVALFVECAAVMRFVRVCRFWLILCNGSAHAFSRPHAGWRAPRAATRHEAERARPAAFVGQAFTRLGGRAARGGRDDI